MSQEELLYNTRDAEGNDIISVVKIKKFPVYDIEIDCPFCKDHVSRACKIKDCVSSSFTDWAFVGDYLCEDCSKYFSLYFYSYTAGKNNGIRLLNVREIRDVLIYPPDPPFLFCISVSKKKHLFYRSVWNYSNAKYAVNLETEAIYTTPCRMRELFDFVECLQTLGSSKERLKSGDIPFSVSRKIGEKAFKKLNSELNKSREIQIPLFCGQKREITEEEAICIINSILTA